MQPIPFPPPSPIAVVPPPLSGMVAAMLWIVAVAVLAAAFAMLAWALFPRRVRRYVVECPETDRRAVIDVAVATPGAAARVVRCSLRRWVRCHQACLPEVA